jgi:hypothetical protein
MAVATTILPARLMDIPLDIRWARRGDLNMLLVKTMQKMAGHGITPTRGPRGVPLLFQVFPQFGKPRFVAELPI